MLPPVVVVSVADGVRDGEVVLVAHAHPQLDGDGTSFGTQQLFYDGFSQALHEMSLVESRVLGVELEESTHATNDDGTYGFRLMGSPGLRNHAHRRVETLRAAFGIPIQALNRRDARHVTGTGRAVRDQVPPMAPQCLNNAKRLSVLCRQQCRKLVMRCEAGAILVCVGENECRVLNGHLAYDIAGQLHIITKPHQRSLQAMLAINQPGRPVFVDTDLHRLVLGPIPLFGDALRLALVIAVFGLVLPVNLQVPSTQIGEVGRRLVGRSIASCWCRGRR